MKKILLTIFMGFTLVPVFSQTAAYPGTLAATDLTFNRPEEGIPPTELSVVGTSVYYDVIPIVITSTGLIKIETSSVYDNFLVLYDVTGFNPAMPLNNALVANDDLLVGGGNAGFTYNFTVTGTYYLVFSAYKNSVVGSYNVTQTPVLILPLRINSFSAVKTANKDILLNWLSSNEENLNTYQVQRSSDGSNFTDLNNGNVAAKNSSNTANYSFTDNNPVSGVNYYRLKITDKAGKISYSTVVFVKNGKLSIANIKVFPNPAAEYLQIQAKTMQNSNAYVSVINATGSILQSGKYAFNSQAVISVNVKNLPAGKYFVKTVIEGDESTIVFVKK